MRERARPSCRLCEDRHGLHCPPRPHRDRPAIGVIGTHYAITEAVMVADLPRANPELPAGCATAPWPDLRHAPRAGGSCGRTRRWCPRGIDSSRLSLAQHRPGIPQRPLRVSFLPRPGPPGRPTPGDGPAVSPKNGLEREHENRICEAPGANKNLRTRLASRLSGLFAWVALMQALPDCDEGGYDCSPRNVAFILSGMDALH
jgi:hypothetical protein